MSSKITNDQMSNRKVLLDVMKKNGFVNYPGEWWHYSFGDRMWAAYLRKKVCHYGPVQQIQK
ncbi:MAG: M15 family metallopeptidase [Candidatus Paceibacterota bacterium]